MQTAASAKQVGDRSVWWAWIGAVLFGLITAHFGHQILRVRAAGVEPIVVALVFVLAGTLACAPTADQAAAEVRQSMEEVQSRLASYAVAAAVEAAKGASFFESFPGVEVDSAMLRADTIEMSGRTALAWGTYFERLRFPGQPTSAQHGRFVMEWRRDADAVWLTECSRGTRPK